MCVIGLVTLIEIRADTQRRNPVTPVTKLPTTNTRVAESSLAETNISTTWLCSPVRKIKGRSMTAEPALVQYASSRDELLTAGREDLMSTAWRAIMSEERTP